MGRRQEKAYRLIAAALLASDLTGKELFEISDRLMFDPRWTERLALYLREIVEISEMSRLGLGKSISIGQRDMPEEFADELAELFSRKRLPKKHVLAILRDLSGSKVWNPDPKRTVRENSKELILTLDNSKKASDFVNLVANFLGYSRDPYLRDFR